MTVLENVMVGSIYGHEHKGKEARKRALEALDLVELNDKKDIITAISPFQIGVFWRWRGPWHPCRW